MLKNHNWLERNEWLVVIALLTVIVVQLILLRGVSTWRFTLSGQLTTALIGGGSALFGALIGGGITYYTARLQLRQARVAQEREWKREDRFRYNRERREVYARFLGASHEILKDRPELSWLDYWPIYYEVRMLATGRTRDQALELIVKAQELKDTREVDKEKVADEFLEALNAFVDISRVELGIPSEFTEDTSKR